MNPPAFPTLPTPPAAGLNTNRPSNIRFTPLNQPVPPVTPPGPGTPAAAGAGAGAAGTATNLTPQMLRAAAAAAAANAPDGAQGEELLAANLFKFSEADLNNIFDIYQELTGRTIFKAPNLPQAKISFKMQTSLTRLEAVQALDTILSMNQISMVPQGTKFVKAVPQAQAGTEGMQFNEFSPDILPESGTIVTHVIQLSNALPADVVNVIQPFAKLPQSIIAIPSTSMLVLRDNSENVKRMLEMIAKVDVVPVQEFESVVIPIKYALAGDIQSVLSSLTAGGGGGTTVGSSGARTSGSGSGFTSRFGGAGGVGGTGAPGSPGYNPANPYGAAGALGAGGLGAGGLGGAGGQRGSFASRLNQIVSRAATGSGDIFVLGQTKIIADERINALLVFASKADLVTISNIIEKLDVVLAQVLIEAIVMEVKVGSGLDYGFSYLQKNPTTINSFAGIGALKNVPFLNAAAFGAGASNALGGGFSYAASFFDFDATMTAMANDSRVNIISKPRIQTSHAVPANLFVGQTRPYVTGSYSYFGGGGPQTQFQQQQIGLTLQVLPLINAEGLVVMDIGIKVQNIGENIPIDANFSVPETIDRQAEAKVAVRDRETVMLGGFISKQRNLSKSGVPILKDIPLLGALFRSTKDTDSRTELVALIRPTVLPSPKDAALLAVEERRNLPALRTVERKFNEDERKRTEFEDHKERKRSKDDLYKREGFSR